MKASLRTSALLIASLFSLVIFVSCHGSAKSGGSGYFVEYAINAEQLYIDGKKISDSEFSALNEAAGELVRAIEREVSVEFDNSDISRINAAGAGESVRVGEHAYRMLLLCKNLYTLTCGKFTPALYNLSELWGFSPDYEGRYNQSRPEPSSEDIAQALLNCNFDDLEILEDFTIVKRNAALKIDLGGIAKGYMTDRLRELVEERYSGKRVEGSITVMSNTILLGEFHESANYSRPWKVGLDNPRALTTPYLQCMMMPSVVSAAYTTSSDMYRYYVNNGKIYCHIIDPETGKPSDRGMISITVVVPAEVPDCGALADAFSTAGFCMNLTETLDFYSNMYEAFGVSAIVICSDFNFYTVGDIEVLNLSEVSDKYTDIFTRAEISDARDRIEICEREREYISRCESL